MQLALGAIGAVAGNFFLPGGFLGMSGAAIGWSFGSFVGGQLFGPSGPDIQGPRLSDRSVSSSAYGNYLPIVYGTFRVGGEVIWSTDLIEHKHKQSAGKGGGGQTYTTYTYTVSFALALSEGEIDGVRKMWFDSKLVYSQADDATPAELQKSAKLAKRMTVYTGTETQTADPTIEAEMGAGTVPGYRGTAYIVFDDLDVTKYGNRIPQITVEITKGTQSLSAAVINTTYSGLYNTFLDIDNGIAYITTGSSQSSQDVSNIQHRVMRLDGTVAKSRKYSIVFADTNEILSNTVYSQLADQRPTYWGLYGITPSANFAIVDVGRDAGNARMAGVMSLLGDSYYWLGLCSTARVLLDSADATRWVNNIRAVENDDPLNPLSVYIYHFVEGKLYRFDVYVSLLGGYFMTEFPTWSSYVDEERTNYVNWPGFCRDDVSGDIYCIKTDTVTGVCSVKRYTEDGDFVEEKLSGDFEITGVYSSTLAYSDGLLWAVVAGIGSDRIAVFDWATEAIVYSSPLTGIMPASPAIATITASGNIANMNAGGTFISIKLAMTRASMPLDEVVTDICSRAGLSGAEIDVTDLSSDNVRGMVIGQQMSARGALQMLGAAYFFDAVESDGILKFVKRGDSSVATFEDSDIGCYENEPVELWQATRTQEEELPSELMLQYAQHDADYQQGAQFSRRESVLAGNKSALQLAIAFTDNEAKAIVDTLMFTAWHNRHGFKFASWQKFHKIEPADVVTVGGETVRITSRSEGVNGLIEFEGVRELPQIYTGQVGAGATGSVGGQTVNVPGPTDYELLDIPPLRDSDFYVNGIYWAAAGYLTDWDGATLLKSIDDGDNWESLQSADTASVFGYASTTIGNFTGGNIFDEINILRVEVNGALSSATWDEVINGANVAIVGNEIIQFRTASLISTGIYDLSGLLRGRRGTEWAMDSHSTSERVVLIEEAALRWIDLQSTDYNTSRLFGAVTHGDTIEDVSSRYMTYAGVNQKAFAPVHPGAGRLANGDLYLQWTRSVAIDSHWIDGRDAGNGMADPTYELTVYSDSGYTTLVRTVTGITTESYTYAYADRTADGITTGTIYFKVRETGTVNGESMEAANVYEYGLVPVEYMTEALALSPVGAWKFDETSGTSAADATGNGNTGTYTGGFTLAQTAIHQAPDAGEYSVELDGSSGYVTIPHNAGFNGAFTVVMLVNCATYNRSLFHHGDFNVGGNQGKLANINSTGKILFQWFNGSTQTKTSTISVQLNTPTFIAIRYNGSTGLIINIGEQKESLTMVNALVNTTYPLKFGVSKSTSFTGFFDGNIDDAVWFNSSLSDADLNSLIA